MRADRLLAAFAVAWVLLCACPATASAQDADDDGHAHGTRSESITLGDLTPANRAAALDAWAHVYCACPDENWSRTLLNCPDGCANRQKQQILRRIEEHWTLDRIVDEQVSLYGTRANADPGMAGNGSFLVIAGLLVGAGIAGGVLAKWRRDAAARRATAGAATAARPADGAETDAVEKELREIE